MSKRKPALTVADRFARMFHDFERSPDFHVEQAKVEISEQIYQAMQSRDVTPAELSRRLGTSRAYVTKILQGNVNFTVESLGKIAHALDCDFRPVFARRHWATGRRVFVGGAVISSASGVQGGRSYRTQLRLIEAPAYFADGASEVSLEEAYEPDSGNAAGAA